MLDECECGHVRLAHDYNGCLMGGDQWDCECKHFRPAVSPDRCPARALAAAPSEEIGGALRPLKEIDRLLNKFEGMVVAHADASSEGDYAIAESNRVAVARAALTEAIADLHARASVDAREAERLRAAAIHVVYLNDLPGDCVTVEEWDEAFDRLRASLRATPPATTTQETKP